MTRFVCGETTAFKSTCVFARAALDDYFSEGQPPVRALDVFVGEA